MGSAHAQTETAADHPLFTGPEHPLPTPHFDQEHLRLALRFNLAERRVFGDATLRVTPLDTLTDTLLLYAAGLTIDSVQIGMIDSVRVAASYRLGRADSLLIALDTLLVPGAPFDVRIVYHTRPRRGLYFAPQDAPEGRSQIWTLNGPEDLRHWLPVFDAPVDPLTGELLITVAPPLRAVSNGRLAEETAQADGATTFHYVQDRPLAPHLIGFAVGEYEVVRESARFTTADLPVPLAYWIYPEQIGDVARTFGRVPAMMRFFVEHLNVPFPWRSYTQVVLNQTYVATSAIPGVTRLSDRLVRNERAALDENPDDEVAQALAQQWFGLLLTPRSWSDSWLQEGLATYLSLLFTADHAGEAAFDLRMQEAADRYAAEARQYRRPLVWHRWTDPIFLFDAHSADKGAWVFHQLRHRLGDDAFRKVLEQFLATYAGKPVTTEDFQRVVEGVARADYDAFFEQWVYAAGHPALDVHYSHNADDDALSVTITQTQEGPNVPEAYRIDLPLEVHTLTDTLRFTVRVEETPQTFSLPVPSAPRFVLVDPDHVYLAQVQVDQPARAWIAQLRYASTPVSRIHAARALAAFADDPALLVGLRNALQGEASAAVRTAIVAMMGGLPPSSALQRVLLQALQDEASGVRVAALDALNAYENVAQVHDAAFQRAQQDPSYRVQAAAVKTLAHTGSPAALNVVRSALITPSHRDRIRQAAFEALALLDVPASEGIGLGLEYSKATHPSEVRAAATWYLRTLAPDTRAALNRLADLLADNDVHVRLAAINALGATGTERARALLNERLATEPQPLLHDALTRAARQ